MASWAAFSGLATFALTVGCPSAAKPTPVSSDRATIDAPMNPIALLTSFNPFLITALDGTDTDYSGNVHATRCATGGLLARQWTQWNQPNGKSLARLLRDELARIDEPDLLHVVTLCCCQNLGNVVVLHVAVRGQVQLRLWILCSR